MKPVSVVEVYTAKFSNSLFSLKIKESLIIEKMHCNEYWKSLSQQLLLEVYLYILFCFHPSVFRLFL